MNGLILKAENGNICYGDTLKEIQDFISGNGYYYELLEGEECLLELTYDDILTAVSMASCVDQFEEYLFG